MGRKALLALVLAVLLPARAWATPVFQAPEGWTARDPGARSRKPPAPAGPGQPALVAVDLEHPVQGVPSVLVVRLRPMRRDWDALHREPRPWVEAVGAEYARVRLLRSEQVELGGVPCARMILDAEREGTPRRMELIFAPGGDQYALLLLSAHPEGFERAQAAVEEVVAHATGLVRPPEAAGWGFLALAALGQLLVALFVVGVVSILIRFAWRNALVPPMATALGLAVANLLAGGASGVSLFPALYVVAGLAWWRRFRVLDGRGGRRPRPAEGPPTHLAPG